MSSDKDSIKKQPEASSERKPSADDTSGSAPVVRAIIEIPDAIIQEYRRNNQEQERENSKNRTIAKWALAGAWIYAAIAVFQWCATRQANALTRKLVQGTVAPLVICSVDAQRVVPRELTVEVVCPNSGLTIADDVNGTVTITSEKFPEGTVLAHHSYQFGGKGVVIQPHEPEPKKWTYPLEGFSEAEEMPRIINWQEIIIADGSVNYSDRIGGTVTRPFCQVYANYTILFPDYHEGFHDGSCQEILPRLRTALKHKQEDEQQKK